MISQNTVFILGAGSSQPYGLPAGEQFVHEIIRHANICSGMGDSVQKETGVPADMFKKMAECLQGAWPCSVDAWLAANESYRVAGKICICRAIASKEDPKNLKGSWLSTLWGSMTSTTTKKPYDLLRNKVNFIIFNYDRVVEEFLFQRAIHFFATNSEECADAVSSLKIVHIYGRIGKLSWQKAPGPERNYDSQTVNNWEVVKKCASCIKTIGEHESDTDELKIAKKWLEEAERVHFLGFGYSEDNLQHLKCQLSTMVIHGTYLGLQEDGIKSRIASTFLHKKGGHCVASLSKSNVDDYMVATPLR